MVFIVHIKNGKDSYRKRRLFSIYIYISYFFLTVILLLARVVLSKYNDFSWDKLLITIAGLDFDLNIDPTMWYIL